MTYLLLTGCGKGIGLSTASLALEQGIKVVGVTRSSNEHLEQLIAANQDFHCIYRDLSQLDVIEDLASDIVRSYGFPKSVILNAGMRCRKSIKDSTVDLAEQVLRTNTLSNYLFIKSLAELKASTSELTNILCVSSIVGTLAFRDLSLYAMSKSALEGFVRSASLELASQNIHLNSIAPGFATSSYFDNFKSNSPELYEWTLSKIPIERWASCEEIANHCLFLVSSKNTYMIGQTVTVDGGWTLT